MHRWLKWLMHHWHSGDLAVWLMHRWLRWLMHHGSSGIPPILWCPEVELGIRVCSPNTNEARGFLTWCMESLFGDSKSPAAFPPLLTSAPNLLGIRVKILFFWMGDFYWFLHLFHTKMQFLSLLVYLLFVFSSLLVYWFIGFSSLWVYWFI